MELALDIILGTLLLLFLDIVLSVDNAILISSTTKNLEGKDRRMAAMIGAAGAVLLRLIFIILLMFFFEAVSEIPLMYIISGFLLIFIGWTMTKHKKEEGKGKAATDVLKAVSLIIAGDIMMSFDNAFIISQVVLGFPLDDLEPWAEATIEISIIAIALSISLVIILLASGSLTTFMKKHPSIVYVATWLLISVGIEMFFKDALVLKALHTEEHLAAYITYPFSYGMGAIITGLNYWYRQSKED